jgi:transcription elongation GreA/GreB family factor
MRIPKRKGEKNELLCGDPYLTPAKAELLKNELNHLIKVVRPKLAQEVQEHAKLGDFSENAAYQIAKGKLRGLNHRILLLEETLKQAIIIKKMTGNVKICLGSRVTVETNGVQKVYHILGSQETDPSQGVISHLSPIGSALLGHKKGDRIKLMINNQPKTFKIISIK